MYTRNLLSKVSKTKTSGLSMGTMMKFVVVVGIILVFVNPSISYECPNSIFSFGDSISDTGNLLIRVGPVLQVAHFPYDETFGRSTGRFSDGLLITDYFAKALGLPILNPYLNKSASFANGVDFAVSGSTALGYDFFDARGIVVTRVMVPLADQVVWFKQYLSSICSSLVDCRDELRRSLFLLGRIGGNDISYPLTQGKTLQEICTYVPFITNATIHSAKEIISIGAKQIVVPANFPIGCFPFALIFVPNATAQEFDQFGCLRSYNELVKYQNSDLQKALVTLKMQYPNVNIIYADYYQAFYPLLVGAPVFGFKINVDASHLIDRTGLGLVIRDNCGRVLAMHMKTVRATSPLHAEILALQFGVEIGSQLNQPFLIESDCLVAIRGTQNPHIDWQFFSLLYELHLSEYKMVHVHREANLVADFIAKRSSDLNLSGQIFLQEAPLLLRGLIRLDQLGVPSVRVLA